MDDAAIDSLEYSNYPKLASATKFIDSLVQMGEGPEEIEYEVTRAANLAILATIEELTSPGNFTTQSDSPPEELIRTIVHEFYRYIYLGDWPTRPKPILKRASYTVIIGFLLALPMNISDEVSRHFVIDPRRYSILSALFRVLDRTGYDVNLKLKLKHIENAQREMAKLELAE
jgi:hypothetical protein